jgi:glycosyltransferase involved in cell wall biosynthesis
MSPKTKLVKLENLPIHAYSTGSQEGSAQGLRSQLGIGATLPVVYTGTLETYQGLDLLLDSAVIVRQHYPDISFVIVGGKPKQVEHWQNEARIRHLEGHVYFSGAVSPAQVLTYLELAEILVSPRINGTSTPLKVYSYLWAGKPTVATNVPAHRQVLSDENACLVAPDKESFASGILKFARDPHLRHQVGRQAKEFANRMFDLNTYQSKMAHVYQMLTSPGQIPDLSDPGPAPEVERKLG